MKNLFDYATKELSQDAFLRWLFESWREPECDTLVKKMLKEMSCSEEEIKDIKTTAQEKNIDIKIEVQTSDKKFFIFIEDKTYSSEHRQLSKYDEYINNLANATYKIFYKTNKISDADKKGIEIANEKNRKELKNQWQPWDINKIINIFKQNAPYKNLILQSYFEYIENIYNAVNTREKPTSHEGKLDLLKWEGFFNNVIKANLTQEGYEVGVWRAGQYPYICLVIKKEGYIENQPYLEITSRDCLNDNFTAKLLLYNVDQNKNQDKIQKLKENIENSSIKTQNNKQQIGVTQKGIARTNAEFVANVEKYAMEFLKIMKDWY